MTLDRRQRARAEAFVGDGIAIRRAEGEGRIAVEGELGDVVVVDDDRHVGRELRQPFPNGHISVEEGFPGRNGLPSPIDDRPDGTVIQWSYAELNERANRLANTLLGLGVTKGTKVVWCGQNSASVLALGHASRKIGATAVPLNYRLSPQCGFSSTHHGNSLTVEQEKAKLKLCIDTAKEVWGSL